MARDKVKRSVVELDTSRCPTWCFTVGLAGFEPTTSSSRSNLGGGSTFGRGTSHLLRSSADVRACPLVCLGVDTQLDTHTG